MDLEQFFKENPKAALGFSGGADSVYLLYAGIKAGADIKPYYVKTAFQPQFELEDAMNACENLGVKMEIIYYDILSCKHIAENPENRCYYCKKELFSKIKEYAAKDGYGLLIDGTNASDDLSERPGTRALSELKVRSPLYECGITKEEIRILSNEAELFTWNKPSYACLATRIPHKIKITEEILKRVEAAEALLSDMGFSDFRIRLFCDAARIQLKDSQFMEAADKRKEIVESLKPYFNDILFDVKPR